jgi:hypothetical protein
MVVSSGGPRKVKRQRTEWLWDHPYAKGQYIRVGFVHNKKSGEPEDVIRWEIVGENLEESIAMRIDEAASLAAGIMKVISLQYLRNNIKVKHRGKSWPD